MEWVNISGTDKLLNLRGGGTAACSEPSQTRDAFRSTLK